MGKSDEEISLFVRDEQTGHLHFNAKALHSIGIDLVQAQQRGYLTKELPDANEHIAQPPEEITAGMGRLAHE